MSVAAPRNEPRAVRPGWPQSSSSETARPPLATTSGGAQGIDALFDAFVFLAAFALYLFFAAPSRTFQDAGELTAAAHDLGVAHPTGFPLWLLAAKALGLSPVGEIAARASWLSILAGAFAALFAARLGRALSGGSRLAAGAAAALTTLGTTAFTQATVVEVYAPTLAATLGALLLLHRVARDLDARALHACAFVLGLGAGLHATLRLAGLAIVLALILRQDTRALLRRHLGTSIAATLAGAAVLLYLPLASARAPSCDWGSPHDAAGLFDHFTAARIRRAFEATIGALDGPRLHHHAALLAEQLMEVISAPGLALLAAGAFFATRVGPAAIALLLVFAADVAFALLVNPMGLADRQTGLPAQAAAAILVALALARLAAWRPKWTRWLSVAAALALAVHAALAGTEEKMRAGDFAAGELVDATLAELPTGALLFSRSDDLSAGALFARVVEGARPDLVHVVRQHIWDAPYLRRAAGVLASPILLRGEVDTRLRHQDEILRGLVGEALESGRAVAWEPADDDGVAGLPVHVVGLAAQATATTPTLRKDAHPKLRALLARSEPLTPDTRRYVAALWDRLARDLARAGAADRAEAAWREALRMDRRSAAAWNNLAVHLAAKGRLDEGIAAVTQATHHGPIEPRHHGNLGLFLLRRGDDAAAREAYDRALALAPQDPRTLCGLGILAARARRFDEARALLRRALEAGAEGETERDARANLERLERLTRPR